jgi:hypothetical protein
MILAGRWYQLMIGCDAGGGGSTSSGSNRVAESINSLFFFFLFHSIRDAITKAAADATTVTVQFNQEERDIRQARTQTAASDGS